MARDLIVRHQRIGCSFGINSFLEGRRLGLFNVSSVHVIAELSSFLCYNRVTSRKWALEKVLLALVPSMSLM